ncbi:MAG: hypothetical protein ACK5PF_10130 [bacterium]|jgi:hypothetical protein
MTLLVLAGTAAATSVVLSMVVPAFLEIAAAIMVWLGVLYVRRRRGGKPWSLMLTLLVGIEVLLIVAVWTYPEKVDAYVMRTTRPAVTALRTRRG